MPWSPSAMTVAHQLFLGSAGTVNDDASDFNANGIFRSGLSSSWLLSLGNQFGGQRTIVGLGVEDNR